MTYSPQCVRCFVASKLVSGETTTHLPQVPRCGQTWTQTGLDGPNSLLWFYPEKNQAGNKAFLLRLAEHYQIFFASLTHITLHIFYTDSHAECHTLDRYPVLHSSYVMFSGPFLKPTTYFSQTVKIRRRHHRLLL